MAERKDEAIIYHSDTVSFEVQVNDFTICYTWQEPLEELSKKEIDIDINKKETGEA